MITQMEFGLMKTYNTDVMVPMKPLGWSILAVPAVLPVALALINVMRSLLNIFPWSFDLRSDFSRDFRGIC